MPSCIRLFAVALVLAFFSISPLVGSPRSETVALRRLTHTPADSLNLNPSIRGDGSRVAFESNAPPAGAQATSAFQLFVADTRTSLPKFDRLAASRAPAPALSQDGTRAAFASKDDPTGRNRDGNSEIFFHDSVTVRTSWQMLPRSSYIL